MREDKFRIYIEMENKMADVCTIDFDERTVGAIEVNLMGHPFVKMWDFDQVKLMQHTGLTHEGAKIYEGDTIHAEGHYPGEGWYDTGEHEYNFIGEVVWSKEKLAYTCGNYYLHELDIAEITGNIYENPGLIKEK